MFNIVKYTEPNSAPGYVNEEVEIAVRYPPYDRKRLDYQIYVYDKITMICKRYYAKKVFHAMAKDGITPIFSINKKLFVYSHSNRYLLSYGGKELKRKTINDEFKEHIENDLNEIYLYYNEIEDEDSEDVILPNAIFDIFDW